MHLLQSLAIILLFIGGISTASSSWQSMSPFDIKKLDSKWGSDWSIRGSNWMHNVKQKVIPGAPLDDNIPVAVSHSFSTCSDGNMPNRNGLSSGTLHLPEGAELPAVVTAEFQFIISENCIEAHRPNCASIELWLLEGVAPTSQAMLSNNSLEYQKAPYSKASFLSDTIVFDAKYVLKNNGTIRKSTMSFAISRPPFKVQFRDRKGACLEIVEVKFTVTSCFVGSARYVQSDSNTTTETPDLTTIPNEVTTPRTQDLLSELDCKCPAGYWRTSKCQNIL